MTKQSRGIRNNNPGNIDYNKNNQWRGQTNALTAICAGASMAAAFWCGGNVAELLRKVRLL